MILAVLALAAMTNAYNQMRSHATPVPTPMWVRLLGSALAATAATAPSSALNIAFSFLVTIVCLVVTGLLVFAHPYRRRMRRYADEHNVTMLPSIQQLVPLFLLWFIIMVSPAVSLALWASLLTWAVIFLLSFLAFPHVDGSRKLAYANPDRDPLPNA